MNASANRTLAIIGAAAIGGIGAWLLLPKPSSLPPPQPPLMSLEAMGHIVSVKVNYANVIEFSDRITQGIPWTQWELRFGSTKVLLVARGDCLVGTDFRQAKYEGKDEIARTVVLSLPSPTPLSARVNHDSREKGGSYFFTIGDTGIVPLIPGSPTRTKAIDGALQRAQREVEVACRAADVIATAKKNTEELMKPTYVATGWKMQVRWR